MTRLRLAAVLVLSFACRLPADDEAFQPVPLLSPEDEARTFVLPPGLHAEVVAAEPMVEHPVAIAFDAKGRMWVAEMRGYMPDVDGNGEKKPTGRVSVLEDTDGDGRMDKSTVFLDHLVLPRAVGFAGDGVLIGSPPNLLFCRDTNGDDVCDEQKTLSTDYGIVDNPENSANGLVYGLDNWIYSACSTQRFRYKGNGNFDVAPTPVMGQFGLTRDDVGRWYFNTNSDYLRGSLVPPHYTARNPKSPMSLTNTQVAKDQDVFPTSAATLNRGYRDGFRTKDGKLIAFTAACSPCIYRADLLPAEYYGNAFVCEATSSMIRRAILKDNGVAVTAKNAYPDKEFLTSTYERFRPVNLATGPDGALYIVDMHHGLIQHRMSLTDYAKDAYLKKQLDKHLLTGRIFRIVPDGKKPQPASLAADDTAKLVAHLNDESGWARDTAQRLLVERKDAAAAPALRQLATSAEPSRTRIQALWTLQGLDQLEPANVRTALADKDPNVRVQAVRLAEPWLDKDLFDAVAKLANDPAAEVRLQVVLSMGSTKGDRAEHALAAALKAHGSDPTIREAAVSGLAGREIPFLQQLLSDPAANHEVLTDVARSVVRRDDPKEIAALVNLIDTDGLSAKNQSALAEALPAKRVNVHGAATYIPADREPPLIATFRKSKEPALKKAGDKIANLFTWPGKPAPPKAKVPALTEEQKDLFNIGQMQFGVICAQCHQPDGMGLAGKAPPLVGSPWVDGPPTRLVRILLHGMHGPITVRDQTVTGLEMPSLKILSDEQIAGVLTYVRRSFGHEASPVDTAFVQGIRDWNQARRDAWTEEELLKIK